MGRTTNERELSVLLKYNPSLFKRLRTDRKGSPCCDCIAEVSTGRRKKIQKAVAEIERPGGCPNSNYRWDPICMVHLRKICKELKKEDKK